MGVPAPANATWRRSCQSREGLARRRSDQPKSILSKRSPLPKAEWHFGWGPVTAHDVVLSHELHTGEDSTLTGAAQLKADEVVAIDDHTVEFRFEQPRIDYAFLHAGRGSMYVYSKAQYDAEGLEGYDRRPAGTGPYQYKERIPGVSVIFERVEGDHWSGIRPDFQEFEMR